MSPLTAMPAAVLLDMDGTLVDSGPAVERAWTSFAVDHGLNASRVLAACHGAAIDATIRRFLPGLDDDEVARIKAHQLELEESDLGDVVAIEGAHELLALLEDASMPWAIVTNSPPALAEGRLAAAGITPPVLVTAGDVDRGKPAPDGFLLAARRCAVDPAQCLAVEDSDAGLQAACAAGMTTWRVGPAGTSLDELATALGGLRVGR